MKIVHWMLSGLLLTTASAGHAARPMITDDARIVDANACQLESWVRRNRNGTEAWALPACNFTGNVEVALGGATHRESSGESSGPRTSDVVMQGKTIFKPLDINGWGMGLAVGAIRHRAGHARSTDWYAYLPTSISVGEGAVVVHANGGWLQEREDRKNRLTWGLGTEARLANRTWLIAEMFGQSSDKAGYQFGVRHWLMPERIQIDATFGARVGDAGGERWISIGLRVLSVPFLP